MVNQRFQGLVRDQTEISGSGRRNTRLRFKSVAHFMNVELTGAEAERSRLPGRVLTLKMKYAFVKRTGSIQ